MTQNFKKIPYKTEGWPSTPITPSIPYRTLESNSLNYWEEGVALDCHTQIFATCEYWIFMGGELVPHLLPCSSIDCATVVFCIGDTIVWSNDSSEFFSTEILNFLNNSSKRCNTSFKKTKMHIPLCRLSCNCCGVLRPLAKICLCP